MLSLETSSADLGRHHLSLINCPLPAEGAAAGEECLVNRRQEAKGDVGDVERKHTVQGRSQPGQGACRTPPLAATGECLSSTARDDLACHPSTMNPPSGDLGGSNRAFFFKNIIKTKCDFLSFRWLFYRVKISFFP